MEGFEERRASEEDVLLAHLTSSSLSRRALLVRGAALAGSVGLTALVAACGGDDDDDDDAADTPTAAAGAATPTTASTTTPAAGAPTATAAATGAAEPQRGGRLIIGRSGDADTLDPHLTSSALSSQIFTNIIETLLGFNTALEYEPVLAESWNVTDDGLQITFTLRQGLTFQDGTPVNAEAIKFTYERLIDPATESPLAGDMGPLEGVEVVDELTARFNLGGPFAPMLGNLTITYYGLLSPTAVQTDPEEFGRRPIGAGPFMESEWVVNDHHTLVPFPDYQNFHTYVENPGAPYIAELVYRTIPEEQTQVAAFETGDVNILQIPPQQVDRFRDSDDVELFEYPATNINFLDFSNTRQGNQIVYLPPFDDIKVRQAVGYAVNSQEIVDGVLAGIAVRNKAPLHNGNFASQPEFAGGFEYDADKAGALLDEAGWVMGDDGVREKDGEPLSIVFMTTNFTTLERVAQLIQNQLQQVGIEVEIVSLEPASYSERRGKEDWNLLLGRDGWPEPDALHFLSHLPDRVGFGRYSEYNAKFEEVLTEARTVSDLNQRRALYEQIAQIILDDAALIPLWSDVNVVGVRSEVQGFQVGPQGRWVFQDAQVGGE